MNAAKMNYSDAELRSIVGQLSKGKKGDSIIARINPREAQMLENAGGVGKADKFGIVQYYTSSDDGKDSGAQQDSGTQKQVQTVEQVEGGGSKTSSSSSSDQKSQQVSDILSGQMAGTSFDTAHGAVSANITHMLTGNPVTALAVGKLADAMSTAGGDTVTTNANANANALKSGSDATQQSMDSSSKQLNDMMNSLKSSGDSGGGMNMGQMMSMLSTFMEMM